METAQARKQQQQQPQQQQRNDNDEVQQVELVDIEDIVPTCGNSLFLSTARALIYMAHGNATLTRALAVCCRLDVSNKSDVALQRVLRERMCANMCERGLLYDAAAAERRRVHLSAEFLSSPSVSGGITNIYDFVLQVMQLGVNNFAANGLFRRHALVALGRMLHMNIFYKKPNGQWRQYLIDQHNDDGDDDAEDQNYDAEAGLEDEDERQHLLGVLRQQAIYLQEFRFETASVLVSSERLHAPISCTRSVRVLLNKRLWLSRQAENAKICMRFAQFSEPTQLNAFMEPCMSAVDTNRIVHLLCRGGGDNLDNEDMVRKTFCVFIDTISMQLLLSVGTSGPAASAAAAAASATVVEKKQVFVDHNENSINSSSNCEQLFYYDEPLKLFEFTAEFNTIGKQVARFGAHGHKLLMDYLNYLWGKCLFTDEFVKRRFEAIRRSK